MFMDKWENIFMSIYLRRVDPDARPIEAYGYWTLILGMLVGLAGIALFLSGSANPRGEGAYWLYREMGIILAAVGLPIAFFSITLRLPLHPAAAAIGSVGGVLCTIAVAWFASLYPFGWTFAGPRPAILTYTAGIALLTIALVVVPMTARPTPAPDPSRTEQPYYELVEGSDGWLWRLHDGDGTVLAESAGRFPTRDVAREAIDELAVSAPTAGTALVGHTEA
jgi:hypothetical protein